MQQFLTKWYVRITEFQRAQTMTEYALILAAVAVVVYAGYQTMGNTILTEVNNIDSKL